MRRRTFLAAGGAALGAALLPVTACSRTGRESAESPVPPRALIAELEKQLPQLMADHFVAGLSIALVRDARVVWRRGFGVADRASGKPVDTDTVFAAQSTSKPVFAYAVLKLVINPKKSDAFRLTRESLDDMVRPVARVPDDPRSSSWALGWQVFDTAAGPVIAHGGNGPGFHAFVAASVPLKSAFVVMTNGDLGWRVIETITSGEAITRLLRA